MLKNIFLIEFVDDVAEVKPEISLLSKKLKYCGNYLNWLQFSNSKKKSFGGNYMRKYGKQKNVISTESLGLRLHIT